jgi:hypothetical protein
VSLASELIDTYAGLAGLRLASFAGGAVVNRVHGINPLTGQATRLAGLSGVSRAVLPSGTALAGIHLGRELGVMAGGQPAEGGTGVADSLAMLAEFALAGGILNGALPGLARFNQYLNQRSEQLSRWEGRRRDHPAKTFRLPEGPSGNQEALALPAIHGARLATRDWEPARPQAFFMKGSASKQSTHAAEITRLHEIWAKGEGRVLLDGRVYQGTEAASIDLAALQEALWAQKRPIDLGKGDFSKTLFGKLRPYLANLNNPPQIYTVPELGHAYYLLGLSIILGRDIYSGTFALPKTAQVKVSQYSSSYLDLLYEKHRGKIIRVQSDSADVAPASTAAPPPQNTSAISLSDVRGMIPPGGGAPLQYQDLTAAVSDKAQEALYEGKVLGWWQGGQANLLWWVPDFSPQDVFKLLRQRELWTQWFPGFYLLQSRGDVDGEILFEIGSKNLFNNLHFLALHSENKRGLQLQWHSPTEAQTQGIQLQLASGETGVESIKGSLTVAPAPRGDGTLVLYAVALQLAQKAVPSTTIRIQNLSSDETMRDQAFLSRGPFVAESLLQMLRNPNWGIKDADQLATYAPNTLKGPIAGKSTYYRLFVSLNPKPDK